MSMDHMAVKTSDVRRAASDRVSKDMKVRKPIASLKCLVEDRKFEPRTIPGFACCLRLFGRNQFPELVPGIDNLQVQLADDSKDKHGRHRLGTSGPLPFYSR